VFDTPSVLGDIYLLKRQVRGGGKQGIPDITALRLSKTKSRKSMLEAFCNVSNKRSTRIYCRRLRTRRVPKLSPVREAMSAAFGAMSPRRFGWRRDLRSLMAVCYVLHVWDLPGF
jgi:hypothetical protein